MSKKKKVGSMGNREYSDFDDDEFVRRYETLEDEDDDDFDDDDDDDYDYEDDDDEFDDDLDDDEPPRNALPPRSHGAWPER